MQIKDKVRFSLVVLAVAQAVVIYWLWNRACPPCYEAGERVVKIDTTWPVKPLEPIVVKVPEAYKTVAKKSIKPIATVKKSLTVDSSLFHGVGTAEADCAGNAVASVPSPCDSIAYYSDTTINRMPDSCIIVVNDTVQDNKISGRSVWFASRMPLIKTTITEVRKEKWKVYIGGAFTFNGKYLDRWGAGPKALVTIPKIGGFDYYYDVKNNAHTIGAMALIRFKR